MSGHLQPIKLDSYKPLRELVCENIRQAIIDGTFSPGERLMEIQLADEMGVSRTPVREAIRKLELEGFVVMIPRRGTYVADISIKDITEIYEIRISLDILAAGLADGGVKNIAMHDISSTHVSTLISEVFRCSHLVLAAPTYNNGVYPAMATFLHDMKALGLQNRTVALVENGSWAPVSGKLMREMLGELKGFQVLEPVVSLKSALKDSSLEPLFQLRDRILDSLNG